MLDRLLAAVDRLNAVAAGLAAAACAALALMLLVEVISTSFFAWSQPWAVEYSTYFLAATLFLGSGWALRAGGHIRVSALLSLLPAGLLRVLDVLVTGFACGVTGFAAAALIDQAVRTYQRGSRSYFPSETPLVYPQTMLALGFVLLALAFVARLIRLLRGQPAEQNPPAG